MLGLIVLLLVMFPAELACRDSLIKDCQAKGGTAIVPSVYSKDPIDVRCWFPPKTTP